MFFLVDNNNKVIFGWSAKCGCSHVKRLFWFLKNNAEDKQIHTSADMNKLPSNIEKYTTIIISRNPYKRIVSGFLDKYKKNGEFRRFWKHDNITFSKFVNELIKNDWKMVNQHHFTPQTSEAFNFKLFKSKSLYFYDIEKINYNHIEKIYNKKIPENVMGKKEGHERVKFEKTLDGDVYNLNLDTYNKCNVDLKYFYNKEIQNKIFKFYKRDFIFFNKVGINYINSIDFK
jgi:hypothetical protein